MDQLEFRRQAIADPRSKEDAFLAAADEHDQDGQLIDKQRQLDEQLRKAMTVTVPDSLDKDVVVQHAIDVQKNQRKKRLFQFLALLVVMGIVTYLLIPQTPFSEQLLGYLYQHQDSLDPVEPSSIEKVDDMLSEYQLKPIFPLQGVVYAEHCQIAAQDCLHLVLDTEHGPVMTLWLPNYASTTASDIKDPRFEGYLRPFKTGSIAFIGENRESVMNAEIRFLKSIEPTDSRISEHRAETLTLQLETDVQSVLEQSPPATGSL